MKPSITRWKMVPVLVARLCIFDEICCGDRCLFGIEFELDIAQGCLDSDHNCNAYFLFGCKLTGIRVVEILFKAESYTRTQGISAIGSAPICQRNRTAVMRNSVDIVVDKRLNVSKKGKRS